jgi:tripartite-type tricarboxylate transporter receptor subunit TctC
VEAEDWIGVFAAADTPPECIKSLGRRITRISESPQFRDSLDRAGLTSSPRDTGSFTAQVRSDVARYVKAAGNAGVKVD